MRAEAPEKLASMTGEAMKATFRAGVKLCRAVRDTVLGQN